MPMIPNEEHGMKISFALPVKTWSLPKGTWARTDEEQPGHEMAKAVYAAPNNSWGPAKTWSVEPEPHDDTDGLDVLLA